MTDLPALTHATWPPAQTLRVGPWLIRQGLGGGQRVSAATLAKEWTPAAIPDAIPAAIPAAEAAMAALGQTPLFAIWQGDAALDAALAARGYRVNDPVVAYAAPCATLATPAPPPLAAFAHWPPLGIATALWAEAGTGPERLAIMQRVAGPKTVILGRCGDRAAGVAFVACHGADAMLHALDVVPALRRQGTAHNMLRSAAGWAQEQGATTLTLLVTGANTAARALYASIGMTTVGHYHYRIR